MLKKKLLFHFVPLCLIEVIHHTIQDVIQQWKTPLSGLRTFKHDNPSECQICLADYDEFSTPAWARFGVFFGNNINLVSLDLTWCWFDADDLRVLMDGLKRSNSLRKLKSRVCRQLNDCLMELNHTKNHRT